MTILILEDELARRDAFKAKLSGHDLTFVEDPLRAAEMIHLQTYDAVFLDHDLGHVMNGLFVAKSFYRSKNWKTPTLVHSINPSGSEEMANTLKDLRVPVTKCPFSSMLFWSVVQRFLDGLET